MTIKKQIPQGTMKAKSSNSPAPSRMTIVSSRRKRAPHDIPSYMALNPARRQMSLMRDPWATSTRAKPQSYWAKAK